MDKDQQLIVLEQQQQFLAVAGGIAIMLILACLYFFYISFADQRREGDDSGKKVQAKGRAALKMDVLALFFWSMGLFRIGAATINSSLPLLLFSAAYVLLAWLRWRRLPIRLLLLTVTVAEFQYLNVMQLSISLTTWGTELLRDGLYLGLLAQVVYLTLALADSMMYALGKQEK